MEFLFGLVLTLLKISVQASVYTALLLLLGRLLMRFRPEGWLARQAAAPRRFWWRSGFWVSAALFGFSFTYWGHHGLGDYARIPLGHGEAIEEINGNDAYFEPSVRVDRPGDQASVSGFQVADETLCAAYTDGTYFTYELATKQYRPFPAAAAYDAHARRHGLLPADQLEDFQTQYRRYWLGWRFWLLA